MAIDPITGHVKPKILVVEDDGDLLFMIKAMLQSIGEVTLAKDGQEALDLLGQGFKPEVIVTDVMMPRIDGITLAKTLKNYAALLHKVGRDEEGEIMEARAQAIRTQHSDKNKQ